MSKKHKTSRISARDVCPGDRVILTYEIEVKQTGDLDTLFPSESRNILFIKGDVVRGPLRGQTGEFAVYSNSDLNVKLREMPVSWVLGTWLKSWFQPKHRKHKNKGKENGKAASSDYDED